MKKFCLPFMIIALAITLALSGGVACATETDEGYTLITPNANNYLYLLSPEIIAIYGNQIVVYDRSDNSINLAGTVSKKINLTFKEADEFVTDMALNGNNLYVLTCYSTLLRYDINLGVLTNQTISDTIQSIDIDNNFLYLYDGLRTIISYDYTTSAHTSATDIKNKIVGTKDIVIYNNTAYCLKWSGEIYSFNLLDKTSTLLYDGHKLATLSIIFDGANPQLLCSDLNEKSYLHKINIDGSYILGESIVNVFESNAHLKAVTSDGTNIAVLDGEDKAVLKLTTSYAVIDIYGCSSARQGWFNNPTAILPANLDNSRGQLVLDSGNARVVHLKYNSNGDIESTFHIPYNQAINTKLLGFGNYQVYIADESNIYYHGNDLTKAFKVSTNYKIKDMAVNDFSIYVLDDKTDTIFKSDMANKGSFSMLALAPDAISIKVADNINSPVYVMTSKGISVLTSVGKLAAEINFEAEGLQNVTDFNIDYVGNIMISSKQNNKITLSYFSRSLSTFTKVSTFSYSNAQYQIDEISAFCINNMHDGINSFALSSNKNMLIRFDNTKNFNTINKMNFKPSSAVNLQSIVSPSESSFYTVSNCLLYTYNNNFNIVENCLINGAKVVGFAPFSSQNMMYVMTDDNKFGYIETAKTTPINSSTTSPTTIRALHDTVNAYSFPSAFANSVTLDKSTIMTITDNAANFNNGYAWYKVNYTENEQVKTAYVMRTRVVEFLPTSEVDKPKFIKVKSSRIGAKVNVYSLADEQSAIITTLTDGTKVQVLSPSNAESLYTLIKVGDTVGYILTSDIFESNGLTSGQIVAILLAGFTIVITTLYFIISKRNRRQSN
ncbi:MAG: hypothetical protein RR033_02010 [Clostridia bacterium]